MSRNSSGRSSYSYKSQEDFQDEILDLKRQLTRLKDESRTLKVKLRRSEENAARKEKIICNMIDPLKAHLSAKSFKCQNKSSQKKEPQNPNRYPSASKVYHHSTCSRAYRHSAKSYEVSKGDQSMICINELPRSERKKKTPSKVTTVIESMHDPLDDLPKAVLSVKPLAVKDYRGENCTSPVTVNNGEGSIRPITNISKAREAASISPEKSCNPQKERVNKKNSKGKTRKKKPVAEKNARSLLFQLCASSENEEDSYSSYAAMQPTSKSGGNVKANHFIAHSGHKVPHDSDNCKRCHSKSLKSVDYVGDNAVTCKIENLIKGGKSLLSMWDEDNGANMKHLNTQGNLKNNIGEGHSGEHNFSREHVPNKFGIYLINENEEVEDSGCVDIIVAEDESETLESWREVDSKTSPSCLIERRASIFRVDIKKKDSNAENEYTEDFKSQKNSNGVIYRSCCEASKESDFCSTNREEMGLYDMQMDDDCHVMEHLMETLSVADGMARNNFEMVGTRREKCLRNTLENLLATTESENCIEKSVEINGEFPEKANMKYLYSGNSNSLKCLTGMLSSELKNTCQQVNIIPSVGDFVYHQECGMDFHDSVDLLRIISPP